MSLMDSLEIAKATHTGMVRSHNEDSIATDTEIGLVVLADGMGGYNAGEVASGIATALISSEIREAMLNEAPAKIDTATGSSGATTLLRATIAKANASIFQSANSQPQYAGMGTTLVTALLFNSQLTIAHIGDSRCYRYRSGKLEQITRDHSLLQEQIDSGFLTREAAKRSQNKNLVTRALGIEPTVEAEIHTYPAQEGDIYLVCSDGLNDMVEDDDIQMTLDALGANLELAAEQLVQMANDNGGRDNISVVLIKVKKDFPANEGLFAKFFSWFK
ncbi:MAG TPA: Stp1/IreP family PP2C-type Ser/Thr phosphatase [Burkholderiales bacterium]|jgi:PPM family protein phosphatase|nr:Stp1/IreP family PP2C-type Ser/Thr phosphatase [Burkholderiales bacterium]